MPVNIVKGTKELPTPDPLAKAVGSVAVKDPDTGEVTYLQKGSEYSISQKALDEMGSVPAESIKQQIANKVAEKMAAKMEKDIAQLEEGVLKGHQPQGKVSIVTTPQQSPSGYLSDLHGKMLLEEASTKAPEPSPALAEVAATMFTGKATITKKDANGQMTTEEKSMPLYDMISVSGEDADSTLEMACHYGVTNPVDESGSEKVDVTIEAPIHIDPEQDTMSQIKQAYAGLQAAAAKIVAETLS